MLEISFIAWAGFYWIRGNYSRVLSRLDRNFAELEILGGIREELDYHGCFHMIQWPREREVRL